MVHPEQAIGTCRTTLKALKVFNKAVHGLEKKLVKKKMTGETEESIKETQNLLTSKQKEFSDICQYATELFAIMIEKNGMKTSFLSF